METRRHRHTGAKSGLTPYQGKNRTFGYFRCHECSHAWMSGNSWANCGQDCQRCMVLVYPYRQRPLEKRNNDDEKIDPNKPHPETLCQKCKELGFRCTALDRDRRRR